MPAISKCREALAGPLRIIAADGTGRAALRQGNDEPGASRRDALLRRLNDQAQQVGVTEPSHFGHQVELAIPAPAGVRIDLEQFDLARRVGTEIEPCVVAAAEPFEQDLRIVGQFAAGVLVERRLAIGDRLSSTAKPGIHFDS